MVDLTNTIHGYFLNKNTKATMFFLKSFLSDL